MSHSGSGDFPATIEDLFGMKGKIALVLGGGIGHGESCAKWLAFAGCDVVVADILSERAAHVATEIRAMGRRAYQAVGDMCEPSEADRILAEAEAAFGGIDIVVSVIGEGGWFRFLDMTMEDWHRDQRRNLDYVFHCSQWVARSMIRRGTGGAICAIASVDGLQSSAMHAAYGAAKAGVVSLIKSMAMELAEYGIRANAVAPGTIKTPRMVARTSADAMDERARRMGIPLGRAGIPDEVAHAVLYLVSDMARYVTGITLPVDGGWLSTRLDIGRLSAKAQADSER